MEIIFSFRIQTSKSRTKEAMLFVCLSKSLILKIQYLISLKKNKNLKISDDFSNFGGRKINQNKLTRNQNYQKKIFQVQKLFTQDFFKLPSHYMADPIT